MRVLRSRFDDMQDNGNQVFFSRFSAFMVGYGSKTFVTCRC